MNNQTLGHIGQSGERCEYLTLSFSPFTVPIRARWRNNGVSADFLGDYVLTFLPTNGSISAESLQNEIRHAVTYVANELLENAMKYREPSVDIPVGIHLELTSDQITVRSSNGTGFEQAQRYKEFVESILEEDAGDLLVKQLEEGAGGTEPNKSCLGLLTMINDYRALLGWQFEVHPKYSQMVTVTTSVVLPLGNLSGASA